MANFIKGGAVPTRNTGPTLTASRRGESRRRRSRSRRRETPDALKQCSLQETMGFATLK